ncbi:LexA family protein [Pseudomonas sp. NPDC096950]|uniref:LexA family protein n=1 Tax=Pseudomonas sp. NPDC096950 TaxID=3364485 RepID=UPI00383B6039
MESISTFNEWSEGAKRCCDALTPAQRRTYQNIADHLKRDGKSPTMVELAALENVTTGTMAIRVTALIKKGFVKKTPYVRGGLSIVDAPRSEASGHI